LFSAFFTFFFNFYLNVYYICDAKHQTFRQQSYAIDALTNVQTHVNALIAILKILTLSKDFNAVTKITPEFAAAGAPL